jgi:ABC-type sugar transport system substrate-binding protein
MSRRRTWAALAALAGACAAAGCGSGATSSSSTTAKATTNPAVVAADKAVAAGYVGRMSRSSRPGPAWAGADSSPAPAAGKTVAVMPCLLILEACKTLGRNAQEAAKALGWKSILIDGKGDPALEQQAVDAAINRGVNCIVSLAVPGRDYKAQIARAKSRGIHTVVGFADDPRPFGGDAMIDLDQKSAGELLGAYIVANGGGKVVTFNSPQDPQLTRRVQGTADYVRAHGGTVVQQQDFALTQVGPGEIPMMQAVLKRHPKGQIDWVVAPFDEALPPLMKVAQQQGRKEIKFVSFNGNQQALDSIRSGTGQVATVSWALDWVSWAAIDECNRAVQGAPTGVNKDFPIQLTDASHAPPPGKSWEPGFDFRARFRKLWDAAR